MEDAAVVRINANYKDMGAIAWNCECAILRATVAKITQQHAEIEPKARNAHVRAMWVQL